MTLYQCSRRSKRLSIGATREPPFPVDASPYPTTSRQELSALHFSESSHDGQSMAFNAAFKGPPAPPNVTTTTNNDVDKLSKLRNDIMAGEHAASFLH